MASGDGRRSINSNTLSAGSPAAGSSFALLLQQVSAEAERKTRLAGKHDASTLSASSQIAEPFDSTLRAASNTNDLKDWPEDLPEVFKSLVLQLENARNPNFTFILRRVYESQQTKPFLTYLRKRMEDHETDVEQLCEDHSLELSDSLAVVRETVMQVDELKSTSKHATNIIDEWQKMVGELTQLNRKLQRSWQIQSRVLLILEQYHTLRPVLQLYFEVQSLFQTKQYVKAVRKIDQIEKLLSAAAASPPGPAVALEANWFKVKFITAINTQLPVLRRQIKEDVLDKLSDVLEDARVNATKIGLAALIHAGKYYHLPWRQILPIDADDADEELFEHDDFVDNSSTSASSTKTGTANNAAQLKLNSLINFEPLLNYRYLLHILGSRAGGTIAGAQPDMLATSTDAEFAPTDSNGMPSAADITDGRVVGDEWRSRRLKQAEQLAAPSASMMYTVQRLCIYTQQVVSLFAVEYYVQLIAPGVSSHAWMQSLWTKHVAPRVAMVIKNNYVYIMEPDSVARLKNLVVLFVLALSRFGCAVPQQLLSIFDELRDHYGQVLMTQLAREIQTQLDDDNFQCVQVTSASDFKLVLQGFPYYAEPKEFPKKLPFSRSVPAVYKAFTVFVTSYVDFSKDLTPLGLGNVIGGVDGASSAHQSFQLNNNADKTAANNAVQHQIEETTRKAVLVALQRTLSGCIMSFCTAEELTVLQLVRVHENCRMLEYAFSQTLDSVIDTRTASANNAVAAGSAAASTNTTTLPSPHAGRFILRERCRSPFEDLRSQIREHLFSVMSVKVAELVTKLLDSIDWKAGMLPPIPASTAANDEQQSTQAVAISSVSSQPSSYMLNLCAYLRDVLEQTQLLPPAAVEQAYALVCEEQVHNKLYQAVAVNAPCLTMSSVQQVDRDFQYFQKFITQLGQVSDGEAKNGELSSTTAKALPPAAAATGDATTSTSFMPLSIDSSAVLPRFGPLAQLLQLLRNMDWDTYVHEYHQTLRNKRYALVSADKALGVLEKLRDADRAVEAAAGSGKASQFLSNFKKTAREKNKLLDQVIKQVKQLTLEERDNSGGGAVGNARVLATDGTPALVPTER